ncbi:hypothetical protein OHB26_31780 [Nocardia sp. NBC_01503]|uniref:nitrilase-related carbon-nitrogen hydrolase n=1 Tax=Nocardia sp. NBC_01503 TaxID=2975997 RepID=UPI002E7AF618|nr:nitrilase-related carbon-nitrogen hydrolase [Nocardia sp. NBC_01503]WTL31448.1 hypothetical protein OHB26_31780 [Nocardia sp. NBC_01503]
MTTVEIVADLLALDPPPEGGGLRIALYQGAGEVGTAAAVEQNMERLEHIVRKAAEYRAQLVVFPEKYNTGYAIGVSERDALAETVDGPSVERARRAAKDAEIAIVLPYPEREPHEGGSRFYDAIACVTADGTVAANYRKTHLYGAAERRNYSFGSELPPVVEINGMTVGILNCYECEFPPLYQYLAEQGARIVIGPTAADRHFTLADGSPSLVPYQDATRHIIPAMASVWGMFVAYCNRRGWEETDAGCWQYRANSGIWSPTGEPVIAAGPEHQHHDALFIADCRPDAHRRFSPEGRHLTDNRLGLNLNLRAGV